MAAAGVEATMTGWAPNLTSMSGPWVRANFMSSTWGAPVSMDNMLPMMGHGLGPGGRFLREEGKKKSRTMRGTRRNHTSGSIGIYRARREGDFFNK